MTRVRRFLRRLGSTIAACVLVVCVALGIAAVLVPAATGSTALTVATSSMEPTYPPGTLVVVRPTPASAIAPGDVVTFQLRSGEPILVTHRVMQQLRSPDGGYLFVTKGDANPDPDPGTVREVQVRGTVWYAVPLVGWAAAAFTTELRMLVVPILAAGLGLYAVWMLVSGIRDRRRGAAARDVHASGETDATVTADRPG